MSCFRYSKKDRELSALEKKYADLEGQIADLEAKLAAAEADKNRWQSEYGVSVESLWAGKPAGSYTVSSITTSHLQQ